MSHLLAHSYSNSNSATNSNLSINTNCFPSLYTPASTTSKVASSHIRDSHLSNVELHEYLACPSTYTKRTRRSQRSLHSYNFALLCIVVQSQEPTTEKEALVLPKWKATTEVELNSIARNHTWELNIVKSLD